MEIVIEPTDELASQVADCKVGDRYKFEGEMTSDSPPTFNIDKAEYTEGEPAEPEGDEAPAAPMKKGMGGNPAIALILGGGKGH